MAMMMWGKYFILSRLTIYFLVYQELDVLSRLLEVFHTTLLSPSGYVFDYIPLTEREFVGEDIIYRLDFRMIVIGVGYRYYPLR